jgi:hypothetical protein
MKTAAMLSALALAAGVALAPAAGYAAHAGAPYQNVDKKVDQGNDTGDSKVDELNAAQLNQNYRGQNPGDQSGAAMAPGAAMMPRSGTMPPGAMSGGAMAAPGTMAPK